MMNTIKEKTRLGLASLVTMPNRRKKMTRRRRKQKGGHGRFATAKVATKLATLLVKDKGAKQALNKSLGTKFKRGWLGISIKMGKKIDHDMKKKGFVTMKKYKHGDLRRKLCEENWKNWATGPHKEYWRCR